MLSIRGTSHGPVSQSVSVRDRPPDCKFTLIEAAGRASLSLRQLSDESRASVLDTSCLNTLPSSQPY